MTTIQDNLGVQNNIYQDYSNKNIVVQKKNDEKETVENSVEKTIQAGPSDESYQEVIYDRKTLKGINTKDILKKML